MSPTATALLIRACAFVLFVVIPTITYNATPLVVQKYTEFFGRIDKLQKSLDEKTLADGINDKALVEKLASMQDDLTETKKQTAKNTTDIQVLKAVTVKVGGK